MTVTTLSPERIAERSTHVGASEVAALFGRHPYLTEFELWHLKAGNLPADDLTSSDRVFWGVILENAIGAGIAAKTGWKLRKVTEYVKHATIAGMGSSPDFETVDHPRGRGTVQVKNVDAQVFRSWEDGKPPMVYQLQVQHEIACGGYDWGVLACLVGGNQLELFDYEPHPGSIARIEAAVTKFWESVRAGVPPQPDFQRDLETLRGLYSATESGKVLDLSSAGVAPACDDPGAQDEAKDPDVEAAEAEQLRRAGAFAKACASYVSASAEIKAATEIKEAAQAEILTLIEDAAVAIGDGFKVSTWPVASGEVSYTRAAYRGMRVSDLSADKPARKARKVK